MERANRDGPAAPGAARAPGSAFAPPPGSPRASAPAGVPIVLLHGFTGSASYWSRALLAGLGEDGRDVVAVDLPGHGARGGPDVASGCTLEHAFRAIAAAAPGPADLVAYSMGARIALHFALAHPERVRRLVLESGSPGLASEADRAARRAADEDLASRIEAEGVAAFVEEWSRLPVLRPAGPRPPAVEEHVRRVREGQRATGLAGALRGFGTGALPSLWAHLKDVHAPTLVLAGAEDSKFAEIGRRMAAGLPAAELTIVPSAGHTVHLDQPAAWLAAVRAHLVTG